MSSTGPFQTCVRADNGKERPSTGGGSCESVPGWTRDAFGGSSDEFSETSSGDEATQSETVCHLVLRVMRAGLSQHRSPHVVWGEYPEQSFGRPSEDQLLTFNEDSLSLLRLSGSTSLQAPRSESGARR